MRFFAKARLSPALVRWLIVSLACPRKELELAQGRSINGVIPDLAPERGFAALQVQLERLQEFKGQDCRTVHSKETEWCHLTEKLIIRTFGNLSVNYKNFSEAKAVGSLFRGGKHQALDQKYFEDRINAYEAMLRSTIEELRLDLPTAGIAGVHKPGDQYEFYRDVTTCLKIGTKEIFVVDPYLSTEIFDVYANAITRAVAFRLLSTKVPPVVITLANKYAAGKNFQFRTSTSIHDRVLFADSRVWLIGQSLKDAATTKPTYIVEHDEPPMRSVYEKIWYTATVII